MENFLSACEIFGIEPIAAMARKRVATDTPMPPCDRNRPCARLDTQARRGLYNTARRSSIHARLIQSAAK